MSFIRSAAVVALLLVGSTPAFAQTPPDYQAVLTSLGRAGAIDLPTVPLDIVAGRTLFTNACSSCHGMKGAGDGPTAHTLNTAPPAIGVQAQTPELTPTLAYNVVSVGVRGTSMPAFATSLSPQQRWNIINYI